MKWWLCLCPPNTRTHLFGLLQFIFFCWPLFFIYFYFFSFLEAKAVLSNLLLYCFIFIYLLHYTWWWDLDYYIYYNNWIINCLIMMFSLWVEGVQNGCWYSKISLMMPRSIEIIKDHIHYWFDFLICLQYLWLLIMSYYWIIFVYNIGWDFNTILPPREKKKGSTWKTSMEWLCCKLYS